MTHEELQTALNKEIAARDAFVQQANDEVTFRNGRIAMLQQLLAPSLPSQAENSELQNNHTAQTLNTHP